MAAEVEKSSNEFADFELSDGRKAIVKKGKGKDVLMAQAEATASGDSSKFMSAFMAAVTSIDGKQVSSYDIENLAASDFLKIQTEFSRLNFT